MVYSNFLALIHYYHSTLNQCTLLFKFVIFCWQMELKSTFTCLLTIHCESVNRSVVSNSETPWTIACQAPLSMEFSRWDYWGELPFPSPEDLHDYSWEIRQVLCSFCRRENWLRFSSLTQQMIELGLNFEFLIYLYTNSVLSLPGICKWKWTPT